MTESKEIELSVSHSSEGNDNKPILSDYGDVEPTEEELATLRHVSDKIPLGAWLIVICELCERFAFFGLSGPFQNYIEHPLPGPNDTQPGALDRGQQTATSLTTFFRFLCYLTPIVGAILADQFWGKYKTILVACFVYAVGLMVLVFSSLPFAIDDGIAFPGLIVAMVIIGFGTGGVKSNVSPLMGEQYTRTKPTVREIRGKKVIVDPKLKEFYNDFLLWTRWNIIVVLSSAASLTEKSIYSKNIKAPIEVYLQYIRTVQSMFNWFYWTINIGALSSIITTNLEKYSSFWLAYFVPMVVFSGSIIVLVFGRRKFILKPPSGSLLLRAGRVTWAAIRIRWRFGKKPDRQHLLDYAKEIPSSPIDKQFTVEQSNYNKFIDDLKQAWKACHVFAFYPFYWISYNQLSNNMVSQAAHMNVGIFPNDILQNIDPIVLIILIPVFDKVIYPFLRKKNIKFSAISRITCGFICVAIGMAWTAFVQHLIYSTGPYYDYSTPPCKDCQKFNDITAAWQIPSYVLIAISEIFASITGLEYAFTQAPASMKSVVMSMYLLTSAVSSALNFALIPVTVDPKLMWMYASLSMASFSIGVLFFLLFRNQSNDQKNTSSDA